MSDDAGDLGYIPAGVLAAEEALLADAAAPDLPALYAGEDDLPPHAPLPAFARDTKSLLFPLHQCIPSWLQNHINCEDRHLLQDVVMRLEQLGTPQAFRARWSEGLSEGDDEGETETKTRPPAGHIPSSSRASTPSLRPATEVQAPIVGEMDFGCDPAPSFPPSTQEEHRSSLFHMCNLLVHVLQPAGAVRYVLPHDLHQRSVTALYAWLTDWGFLCHATHVWCAVAECFRVCCQARIRYRTARPSFVLPWKPLVEVVVSLMRHLQYETATHLVRRLRQAFGNELRHVCDLASYYFDETALEGIWDAFAPHFSPDGSEAPTYLCLLSVFLPPLRLFDDATHVALPRTTTIANFLLREAYYWQQSSNSWMDYTFHVLSRMLSVNAGLLDLDMYAEPYFTGLLYTLRLPFGDGACYPTTTSGVHPSLKGRSILSVGHDDLHAPACLVNALTNDTDSPLWKHLKRFLHATAVFTRPEADNRRLASRVLCMYRHMVQMLQHRVERQRRILDGGVQDASDEGLVGGSASTCPERHVFSQSAIECFAELLTPVILPALHSRIADATRITAALTALAPASMYAGVMEHVDAGLHSATPVADQRAHVLKLLNQCVYSFLGCAATHAAFLSYLRVIVPEMVPWMSLSHLDLSLNVGHFLFTVATVMPLEELLGGQDDEVELMVIFTERVCDIASVAMQSAGGKLFLSNVGSILRSLSPPAFAVAAERILAEAATEGANVAMAHLVAVVGARDAKRVMALAKRVAVPVLLHADASDSTLTWAARTLSACVFGAGRAALPDAPLVLRCVRVLLSQLTNPVRLSCAEMVYANFILAVGSTRCVAASRRETQEGDANCSRARSAEPETSLLCQSDSVDLTWDEPTPEHAELLMDLLDDMLSDIFFLIENIEEVRPSSNAALGLRGLCSNPNAPPQPSGCGSEFYSSHTRNAGAAAHGDANTDLKGGDHGDGTVPVTPHSVLCAVTRWLHVVLSLNDGAYVRRAGEPELAPVEADGISGLGSMPWWRLWRRCSWSVFFLCPSRQPKFTRETIFDVIMRHVLRRMLGDHCDLIDALGPDVGTSFSRSLLSQGHEPLSKHRARNGDTHGVTVVMQLLLHLTQVASDATPLVDTLGLPNNTSSWVANMAIPPALVEKYPAMYWSQLAESAMDTYTRGCPVPLPRRCLRDFMNAAHVMLFSQNDTVARTCAKAFVACAHLLTTSLRHALYTAHSNLLERGASLWLQREHPNERNAILRSLTDTPGDEGYSTSSAIIADSTSERMCLDAPVATSVVEKGATRHSSDNPLAVTPSVDAADADDDTTALSADSIPTPQAVLRRGLLFLFTAYSDSSIYSSDSRLPLRLIRLLLFYPDALLSGSTKLVLHEACHNTIPTHSFVPPSRALWLMEELLHVALQLSVTVPMRSALCVRFAASFQLYACGRLPSDKMVRVLFRVAASPVDHLRLASLELLSSLFLPLVPPPVHTLILVREDPLEAECNSDAALRLFRSRYARLKEDSSLPFYFTCDAGSVFVPRALRVRADLPEDYFGDGHPLRPPVNVVLDFYSVTADECEAGRSSGCASVPSSKRKELAALVRQLVGIASVPVASEGPTQERLRNTWLWNLAESCKDHPVTADRLRTIRFWQHMGSCVGVGVAVETYMALIAVLDVELQSLSCSTDAKALNSMVGLVSCQMDLCAALVHLTKYTPAHRPSVLRCFARTLLQGCGLQAADDVVRVLVRACRLLERAMTVEEAWGLYEALFAALRRSGAAEVNGMAAPDQSSSCTRSPLSTQGMVRAMTLLVELLYVLDCEINGQLMPRVVEQILTNHELFFSSSTSLIRFHASRVIRRVLYLALRQSNVLEACEGTLTHALTLAQEMEALARWPLQETPKPFSPSTCISWGVSPMALPVAHDGPYPFEEGDHPLLLPPAVSEPPDQHVTAPSFTPNSSAAADETRTAISTVASPDVNGGVTAVGDSSVVTADIATITTVCASWYKPPAPLLAECMMPVLLFLVRALDVVLPRADPLYVSATSSLQSIAMCRLPKAVVHDMVFALCDMVQPLGSCANSCRAKMAVVRMLRPLLLVNLHRIGKYAVMQRVAEAAVAVLSHDDDRLRAEGRLLFSFLTRVASAEQTQALVGQYMRELKELNGKCGAGPGARFSGTEAGLSPAMGGSGSYRRRRIAIVLMLCATLSAHPGTLPPYTPRLMELLMPFSRDVATGVSHVVKKTFEEWWVTHRVGWETKFKPFFTPVQLDAMSSLLMSPFYLV